MAKPLQVEAQGSKETSLSSEDLAYVSQFSSISHNRAISLMSYKSIPSNVTDNLKICRTLKMPSEG
jgi:hypothetical protein